MRMERYPEQMLDNREIDFFIVRQEFNGMVDMNMEHTHNYYEVFYVAVGERIFYQNGIPYKITNEQLLVIPPGYSHKTESVTRNKQILYFFGFSDDYFDGFVRDKSTKELFSNLQMVTDLKNPVNYPIIKKFEMIEEIDKNHDDLCEIKLKTAVFDLIFNYTNYGKKMDDSIYIGKDRLNPRIKYMQIANYIRKNMNTRINLDTISEKFGMSKYEISRNFKKYLGTSFVEYVNMIRIEEAQGLITNTKTSLLDIAETTGFDSLSHFGKTFKKIVSVSPSEFRKMYSNNKNG